jgi:phage host-nuclease inhibitor protein Gam
VQVIDEAKIPDKFFRIIREVDKRAIVDATKAAEQVDGVVVETGKHLRITE